MIVDGEKKVEDRTGDVPRDPAWCTDCRCPESYGRGPCARHRGPDGQAVPYSGPDAYEPSAYVRDLVGVVFRAPRWDGIGLGKIVEFVCDGYDPRSGFWMRDPTDKYQTCVSERAIGRTWHRKW
jgi:hypothetical protein